jgi:hypothetical protein
MLETRKTPGGPPRGSIEKLNTSAATNSLALADAQRPSDVADHQTASPPPSKAISRPTEAPYVRGA